MQDAINPPLRGVSNLVPCAHVMCSNEGWNANHLPVQFGNHAAISIEMKASTTIHNAPMRKPGYPL
jgi:hypothetical protein